MTILVNAKSITDPKQASSMLEQRRKNVLDAYTTLNKIVERHEATIQKRWLGKTRQARLKILLTAWPGMPLLHRPDLKAFRLVSNGNTNALQWQRAAFMWPHINQEDLVKPRTLLLLLNARSRNDPRVFADMDARGPELGVRSGALVSELVLASDYRVKMGNASTLQEYGQLQYLASPASGTTVQPPCVPSNAFLVLEAQERILKFLASVCRLVLHDIAPSAMVSDKAYPVQPEPRLTTEASTGPFESIAAVAAESDYRVPGSPNFDQMESLFAANAAAIQDRIVALREDPAFFAAALQDIYDHSIQQVKFSDGREHPDLKGSNGNAVWVQAIKRLVAFPYIRAGMFADLCQQFGQLRQLRQLRQLGTLRYEADSKEYVYALSRLRYYLDRAICGTKEDLHYYFYSSPPLRDRYLLSSDGGREKSHGDYSLVPNTGYVGPYGIGSNKANAVSLLLWSIKTLLYDEPAVESIGYAGIVDEIQRAMNQENIGSEMITPFIASMIGDLSVLTHCCRMLRQMEPRPCDVPPSVQDAVAKDFDANFNPLIRLVYAMDVDNVHGAASLVNPSNGRFVYPVDKRRTKETVEAMRRAEQNLDDFWAYIDRVMYLKAGNLQGTALEELLADHKAMRRTRKWAEPSAAVAAAAAAVAGAQTNGSGNGNGNGKTSGGGKKKKGGNKAAAKANANANAASVVAGSNTAASTASTAGAEVELVPLSPFFYNLYRSKPEAPQVFDGSNGSNESSTGSCYGSNGSLEANGTTIKVESRALKVFRALYFNPDVSSTFGGIPWNDFVSAMSSVGFQAEKMYGSLWHFRPAKQGVAGVSPSPSGSILFYEPFSQSKMSFDGARWIGRRLARAYGWKRDTFVAKGK